MKSRRASRPWSPEEDDILRAAVNSSGNSIDWHEVASRLPQRSNKDCRKRWVYSLQSSINKGPWSEDEDKRLLNGVEQHGFKWALIGPTIVGTRQPDQCSRRWHEVLNPRISHGRWSPDEDEILEMAVGIHGRRWTEIVERFFPNRTPIAARTRYAQRFEKGENSYHTLSGNARNSRARRQTVSSNNASDSYELDDSRDDSSDDETSSTNHSRRTSSDVRCRGPSELGSFPSANMISGQRPGSVITNPPFQTPAACFYNSNPSFAPVSYSSYYGTEGLQRNPTFNTISHHPTYQANLSAIQQSQFQPSGTGHTINYTQDPNISPEYYDILNNDASAMLGYDQLGQITPMPLSSLSTTQVEGNSFYTSQPPVASINPSTSASNGTVQFNVGMPVTNPRRSQPSQRVFRR